MGDGKTRNWEEVLWREWRRTRDEGLAALIWDSLADAEPTDEARQAVSGWGHCTMAVIGALVGLILGAFVVGAFVGPDADALTFGLLGLGVVAGIVGGWKHSKAQWRRTLERAPTWRRLLRVLKYDLEWWAAAHAALGLRPLPDPSGPPAATWSATGMPSYALRQRIPWWKDPPGYSELVRALRHPDAPDWAHAIAEPIDERDPPDPRALCDELGAGDAAQRWRAHLRLLEMEGRAVPAIADAMSNVRMSWKRGMEMLRWIGARTEARFGDRMPNLVCPRCYAALRRQKPGLALARNPEYIACRSCGYSREAIAHGGSVICTLDSTDDRECVARGGTLRVNWLARARARDFEGQALFDFDEVEIVNATDDEVRHFLVDIANDTDAERRKAYRRLAVTVGADCRLGPNTLAALRECFPRARR